MSTATDLQTPRPWGERMYRPDPEESPKVEHVRVPTIDGETPICIIVTAQEIGLAWKQRMRPGEYMNLILEKLREAVPDAVEGVFHLKLVKGHLMKQKFGAQSRDGMMRYVWMSDNYHAAMRKASGEVK